MWLLVLILVSSQGSQMSVVEVNSHSACVELGQQWKIGFTGKNYKCLGPVPSNHLLDRYK